MSNAEDLRLLAQDITASYDARIGELASIRQQTSDMLSEFHRMDDERKTSVSNIKKEVSGMLDGFKKEQEDTASAWRDLVDTMESKRGGSRPSVKTFKKKTHRRSEELEKSK